MKHSRCGFLTLIFILFGPCLVAQTLELPRFQKIASVEVGDVRWTRDYDRALQLSEQSGKPLFLLFQEVPGCVGCRNFGNTVLRNSLLVEAIESEFVPVLLFNNRRGGIDEKLLKQFDEPSWNYQVIRFINSSEEDIIPRRDEIWTISGVASRMIETLAKIERTVPLYLQALALENDHKRIGLAAFSMACFWTGEYQLGKIEGVVSTEAGWYDNQEVTLVRYHKDRLQLKGLINRAREVRCARKIYLQPQERKGVLKKKTAPLDLNEYRTARSSDQKKQIGRWLANHQSANLTAMQRTKVNSFFPDSRDQAMEWLSPRQLATIAGGDRNGD